MANICLPSGDILKPAILGNWAKTASDGTWMLAAGGVWAKATKLELATHKEINTLGNLAISIFTLVKKKAPAA
jgi:hypothetical protein